VEDFSLNLISNEITALLGNNGAGKTTLIKILMGEISFREEIGYVVFNDGDSKISIKTSP